MTITDARKEKVDFSNPYYTSVQYVIYKATDTSFTAKTATDGTSCVFWSDLMNKKIGVQRDTTGHIYVEAEMETTEDYTGVLVGTTGECTPYDNAQLAVDAIGANHIDVVVVDELPAQFICNANTNYVCKALYYDADTATEEQYAICVTKGNTELLTAINAVLAELGENGINELVKKHLGLTD
ncbi:MAG: transporter substrate-binding domain-containing protein [Clostridia bacterium]|nr:transporter substrate-binding domain-containing protein [Clostridia bacterium]